jgi:hypothetical protein
MNRDSDHPDHPGIDINHPGIRSAQDLIANPGKAIEDSEKYNHGHKDALAKTREGDHEVEEVHNWERQKALEDHLNKTGRHADIQLEDGSEAHKVGPHHDHSTEAVSAPKTFRIIKLAQSRTAVVPIAGNTEAEKEANRNAAKGKRKATLNADPHPQASGSGSTHKDGHKCEFSYPISDSGTVLMASHTENK